MCDLKKECPKILGLEDINGVFTVLSSLKYLSLIHNHVKWFDVAFFSISVQSIHLGNNKIEEQYSEIQIISPNDVNLISDHMHWKMRSNNQGPKFLAKIFLLFFSELKLESNGFGYK